VVIISPALNCVDLSYKLHNNKIVTIVYKSDKRYKTKLLKYLKINHNIDEVNHKIKDYKITIKLLGITNKYKRYEIIDID
jgi:hypothetical protein